MKLEFENRHFGFWYLHQLLLFLKEAKDKPDEEGISDDDLYLEKLLLFFNDPPIKAIMDKDRKIFKKLSMK